MSVSRFARDQRGAIAVLFAMLASILIGVAGVAVDYLRGVTAKARLQYVVDAAALAGATAARNGVDAATTSRLVQTIFSTNLGGASVSPQIQIEKVGTAMTVSVSAQHEIPTVIGQILGVKTMPVRATGKAQAEPVPTGSITAMN